MGLVARAPRVALDERAWVHSVGHQLATRARNISRSGVHVFGDDLAGVSLKDQVVRLFFTLPGNGVWHDVDALVVREALGLHGIGLGLRFLNPPAQMVAHVQRFVLDRGGRVPLRPELAGAGS